MKVSENLMVIQYSNNSLALVSKGEQRELLTVYKISPYGDIVQNSELSKDIIKAYEKYYNNISTNIPKRSR